MRLRTRKRTLRSSLLRVFVPRVTIFAGGVAMLAVGQAMAVQPAAQTTLSPTDQVGGTAPAWTVADAAAYPECTPSARWPAGKAADFVVVQASRDGRHRKVAFDRAWRANHNGTEVDDVWVLGVCGRTGPRGH